MSIHLPIINRSRHPLPAYQTVGAAGFDLTANIDQPISLAPLERAIVPTGLFCAIPPGHELQIRPRSGLAAKHGITVLNAPGTIDADYRGELMVILVNLSSQDYTVQDGDRIAQAVLATYVVADITPVDSLDSTSRGSGGLGHTG